MGRESFLPLFFGDFMASTAEWAGEEASLYLTCLGYQWTLGSLPEDSAKVCRLVRWERRTFEKAWPQVREKFEARDGRLYNARLEQHRERTQEIGKRRAEAGAKGGAAKRQAGSKAEAIATAGLQPGSSIHPIQPSISLPSGEKGGADAPAPKAPVNFGWGEAPEGCDSQAWAEWAAYKRGHPKAATITKHANFMRSLTVEGQRAAVDHSIRNQYAGCFSPKDGSRGTPPQGPRKSAVERVREATGCDLREVVGAPPPRLVGTG